MGSQDQKQLTSSEDGFPEIGVHHIRSRFKNKNDHSGVELPMRWLSANVSSLVVPDKLWIDSEGALDVLHRIWF